MLNELRMFHDLPELGFRVALHIFIVVLKSSTVVYPILSYKENVSLLSVAYHFSQ
jgi:hypothetical protein